MTWWQNGGGLNAQGYLCVHRDMPKRCYKRLYLRGTLMRKKCAFLQCSAGRWPKMCRLIIISLLSMKTAFVLRFPKEEHHFFPEQVSSWIEIDWKWLTGGKKVWFEGKVLDRMRVLHWSSFTSSDTSLTHTQRYTSQSHTKTCMYLKIRQWCRHTLSHTPGPVNFN